ncbi:aquaporin [Phenylobacterium parvum]|uniref:Aquaporin n=1 Tax=Phenylobacterium parvum TaxID=2201350 RepID=A0A2Z3HT06_9CAUL|nr:aquaporin [Phenylobacterium parvum]AWM77955.1 aquaporin [Phenylobacterium parvum]
MSKMLAEFIGTFTLVLFGCGSAVLGGFDNVGQLGISIAFGGAIIAMAYGIGSISGCHVNPAVSLAAFIAGRMNGRDMVTYWVAQFAGALAAAAVLAVVSGQTTNLGQNGFGPGYLGEFSMQSALLFEIVMTALFVIVILGSTSEKAPAGFAGVAIGVTLAVIHIVGIQVTGVSVNPARSFGPAVLVGGPALAHLWLFFVAPAIGAVIGALLYRVRLLA